jgi:hypothetical protein
MEHPVESQGMSKASKPEQTVRNRKVLGELATWGSVGYTGRAFAPAASTYEGIDSAKLNYTHVADSGAYPSQLTGRAALANLVPLMHAAQWEAGFGREAGPLSTWSN